MIVDERLRLSSRRDLPEVEKKRLEKALKVLASASSYGIYAQMDREDSDDKFNVTCHGIDAEGEAAGSPSHCCWKVQRLRAQGSSGQKGLEFPRQRCCGQMAS